MDLEKPGNNHIAGDHNPILLVVLSVFHVSKADPNTVALHSTVAQTDRVMKTAPLSNENPGVFQIGGT